MTVYNNPSEDSYAPSFQDIKLTFKLKGGESFEVEDIKSITLNTSVDIGSQRAAGGVVARRTTGSETHTGSFAIYRAGWQAVLKKLVKIAPLKKGKRRIGGIHFSIEVQHSFPGEDEIYSFRVKGCRIAGREASFAEGNDADTINVPMSIGDIVDVIDGEEIGIR